MEPIDASSTVGVAVSLGVGVNVAVGSGVLVAVALGNAVSVGDGGSGGRGVAVGRGVGEGVPAGCGVRVGRGVFVAAHVGGRDGKGLDVGAAGLIFAHPASATTSQNVTAALRLSLCTSTPCLQRTTVVTTPIQAANERSIVKIAAHSGIL